MRTACIIPVLNQFPITEQSLRFLSQDEPRPFELIVLDNGSADLFSTTLPNVDIVRSDVVFGPYRSFFEALRITNAEFLAFFHSDVFVYEKDWWKKIENAFDADPKLGLIGFVGSNEIDSAGGRGLGTASNFQGKTVHEDGGIRMWTGSSAEAHGRRLREDEIYNSAVIDGCVMIFRRSVLEQIPFRDNFPIHHFYDRLLSCQVQEIGYEVATMGIPFDHISGQTANQEGAYQQAAKQWAVSHHITPGGIGTNWDSVMYNAAERIWLKEYREEKRFIPRKV